MTRREAEDGPAWLSPTAARVVLDEAVEQAVAQGLAAAIERVVPFAGYRRRLAGRFRSWTLFERSIDSARGRARESPIDAAEETVFELYRELLDSLGAEDEAGMAVWASKRLARSPRFWSPSGETSALVFLDFDDPLPAHWRLLNRAVKTERAVHVTLSYDADPALKEVYHATEPLRARLLELGFLERPVEPAAGRPEGLRQVERSLFQSDGVTAEPITSAAGLTVRGAPEIEGESRTLAREIRERLERGVAPEEILVLFRHWDETADVMLEMLHAWEIPAAADFPRSLRGDPAAAALRLAASIPIEDWETELVIRLLRHGQFHPAWPAADRLSLARAASTVRKTYVFRGADQLLAGLDRLAALSGKTEVEPRDARAAHILVDRLIETLKPLDQDRSWSGQTVELFRIARELGIGGGEESALDVLWDALDDQADMLDRLGRGDESWSWEQFTAEVGAILDGIEIEPAPTPGSVRLTTVERAEGARAELVILANLEEGSFPAREAVEPLLALGPLDEPDAHSRRLTSREMLRFLKVLGSADTEVVLLYPSTDVKGQELLRAGFLDDLLTALPLEAEKLCHRSYPRLDPALLEQPELAGSPADLRIRALARASAEGRNAELIRLAGDPAHRPVLDGVAAALFVQQRRARGTDFSEFEGLITDPAVCRELERKFSGDYPFSPSQLETYLACPFQFFCRFVLNLRPIEEKDELDEDLTEQGSRLHDLLENLENWPEPDPDLKAAAVVLVDQVGEREAARSTDLDRGLWEIERERLIRTVQQYLEQRLEYERQAGRDFKPLKLELAFGDGGEYPAIQIGEGERTILIRGRIDRIDVAETAEGSWFRVIDYKSGKVSSLKEVKQGAMLQLPIYAIAVEQLLFQIEPGKLADLGYWALKNDGYKAIAFPSWDDDKKALRDHVLALVDDLRKGVFVVDSRSPNCESYCDYRNVCRIGQVRRAGKSLERRVLELSVKSPSRGKASAAARPGALEEEP